MTTGHRNVTYSNFTFRALLSFRNTKLKKKFNFKKLISRLNFQKKTKGEISGFPVTLPLILLAVS